MPLSALLLVGLAPAAFGAPFPHSAVTPWPGDQRCSTRYEAVADAPLAAVASFYAAEAAQAGVPVLGDTKARFTDYRTLVFVSRPRFLSVVLNEKDHRTTARVSFHTAIPPGC